MLADKIQPVIARLNEYRAKSPFLVAIDGRSAAGKSTLASAIRNLVSNATIVHMDDFYRVLGQEERARLDAEDGFYQYYDWQRLEAQVLKPLVRGEVGRCQRYDWATNSLVEWTEVQPVGIILIEGCYASRPELKNYYDLMLFVETSAAQRLQRQYERADATCAWLDRWHAAEQYYIDRYQPHRYADLVIAGE